MEKIKFEYQGKQYELTPQEINAAYFYRLNKDRLEDAKRHLEMRVFGDEIHTLNERVVEDAKAIFRVRYGIDYTQIQSKLDDSGNRKLPSVGRVGMPTGGAKGEMRF